MGRRGPFVVALTIALAVVLLFLILPVVAIFVDAGPGELLRSLGSEQAREALWLSLRTTLAALAIIVLVGTPAAYLLATREFRGKAAVTTAITSMPSRRSPSTRSPASSTATTALTSRRPSSARSRGPTRRTSRRASPARPPAG